MSAKTDQTIREVSQLTRSMKSTLKRWGKQYPSHPDIADAVAGWKKDIENLEVLPSIEGYSYQSALDEITKAWDNRDDAAAMVDGCEKAADNLDNIPVEMATPEFEKGYMKRQAKSLFNDVAQAYGLQNNESVDIYNIKRVVDGMMRGGIKAINYTAIKSVRNDLMSLANGYADNHPFKNTVLLAVKYIDMAHRADQPMAKTRYIKEVSSLIDNMGQMSAKSHLPSDYRPELDAVGAREILRKIEGVQGLINGYSFTSPDRFMPTAIKAMRDIVKNVNVYFDPKAKRLAADAHDNLVVANSNSHSYRVKAMNVSGWNVDEVFIPFNNALNFFGDLERHIRNIAQER